jgi:hypothetical protein
MMSGNYQTYILKHGLVESAQFNGANFQFPMVSSGLLGVKVRVDASPARPITKPPEMAPRR